MKRQLCFLIILLSLLLNAISIKDVLSSEISHEWISLDGNFPVEELKNFQGTLRYVPGSGKPDIVMRYNAYKLEQTNGVTYDIANNSEELKSLVDQKVEIEGKYFHDIIESKEFQEIWPTRIRTVDNISPEYVDPIPHLKIERTITDKQK